MSQIMNDTQIAQRKENVDQTQTNTMSQIMNDTQNCLNEMIEKVVEQSQTNTMSQSMDDTQTNTNKPPSYSAIIARMKKRQAENPSAADQPKEKKAYTGNLRVDIPAVVINAWDSEKSQRFTVIVANHNLQSLVKNERANAYYENGVIHVRPQNGEEYTETIEPNTVFEFSRWHGGKEDASKKEKYVFGDSITIKRFSMKMGNNGERYGNCSWVERSNEQFDWSLPDAMKDLSADNYHKAVVFGTDGNGYQIGNPYHS